MLALKAVGWRLVQAGVEDHVRDDVDAVVAARRG